MKKTVYLVLLIIFVVVVLVACQPTQPQQSQNDDSYALFLYMSGSDLESGSGAASSTIDSILTTQYSDNVKVYIMTGGCASWKNAEIPNDSVMIYEATNGQLDVVKDCGLLNMGDENTLKSFMTVVNGVKADKKVLLLWGHGSSYGICPDSLFGNDMLTYQELQSALYYNYFDLIIFNACYTANLDLITFVQNYAEYAIASEDVLPSLGYNYQAMLQLFDNNNGKDIEQIGKEIIDDTLSKYSNSPLKDTLTLSLVNLAKLRQYYIQINNCFYEWRYGIDDWLRSFSLANTIGSCGKDFVDVLGHFGGSTYLNDIISEIVTYEIHGNRYDTDGLYIYYKENINSNDMQQYTANCAYNNYLTVMQHLVELKEGNYLTYITSTNSGQGVCDAILDEFTLIYGSTFAYSFYDSNKELVKTDTLCIESQLLDGNNYTFLSVPQGALFLLQLNGITLNYELITVQESEVSQHSKLIYTAKATVNDKKGVLYFTYDFKYDFDKQYFGQLDGYYTMIGFLPESGDDWFVIEELKKGDTIELNGQSFVYDSQPIQRVSLPNGYYITITVSDIYGNKYYTPKFEITNTAVGN